MTSSRYFRNAIWAPLAVPVLVAPIVYLGETVPDWVSLPATFLTGSVFVAGVPYLAFAIHRYRWIRRREPQEVEQAALWAPIAFLGWFFPFYLGWVGLAWAIWGASSDELYAMVPSAVILTGFIVVCGYLYVAVILGVLKLLRIRGSIRDPGLDRPVVARSK